MFYIDGYKDYDGKLAVIESNNKSTRSKKKLSRLRIFPNIKYIDFHRERESGKLLHPILPWEILIKQDNYFVYVN